MKGLKRIGDDWIGFLRLGCVVACTMALAVVLLLRQGGDSSVNRLWGVLAAALVPVAFVWFGIRRRRLPGTGSLAELARLRNTGVI